MFVNLEKHDNRYDYYEYHYALETAVVSIEVAVTLSKS